MARISHIASWLGGRRQIIVVVLAGWIALVAMSAGAEAADDALFRLPDLTGVIVGLGLISVLIGLLFVLVFFRAQDGPLEQRPPRSRFTLLITVAMVLLLLALDPDLEFETPAEEREVNSQATEQLPVAEEDKPAELGNLTLLLVVCAGASGLLLWSRHRLGDSDGPGLDDDIELDAQIGSALADATQLLSTGSDPRSAVLAAYANLEQAFADIGRPRHHSETATEHLKRVLDRHPDVSGPAVRLGHLYELARFSEHRITVEDQQGAAADLAQAQHRLSSTEPSSSL